MTQGFRYRPAGQPRGEDTRRRILDAAIVAFAADGYEGASTRRLAEQAGVNLPAIQYYFGSKEGLFRAAIEHIVQQNDDHMAPVGARVSAALARGNPPPEELLALLLEVLDAFLALLMGGEHLESRRLLFARAETEHTAALDLLHEAGKRQVLRPCAELIGALLGRPADDEEVVLRAMMVLGQIVIFCNKGARRALGWTDCSEHRLAVVQALLREQTAAIFRATRAHASD